MIMMISYIYNDMLIFHLPRCGESLDGRGTRATRPEPLYIYIYIYRERERYIYIYICIYWFMYYCYICTYITIICICICICIYIYMYALSAGFARSRVPKTSGLRDSGPRPAQGRCLHPVRSSPRNSRCDTDGPKSHAPTEGGGCAFPLHISYDHGHNMYICSINRERERDLHIQIQMM